MAGRPHKGDRVLLQARPFREVLDLVVTRQRDAGVSSLSQYIADVLAIHVGRDDLIAELDYQRSLLRRDPGPASEVHTGRRVLVQTRPHRMVWLAVHTLQGQAGVSSVSQYVGDVLAAHVGRDDLVAELGHKEGLPLAI